MYSFLAWQSDSFARIEPRRCVCSSSNPAWRLGILQETCVSRPFPSPRRGSPMEVDGPSTSQADAPELPVFSIPVLQVVKDGQSLHGLKHSDYQRYRRDMTSPMSQPQISIPLTSHYPCPAAGNTAAVACAAYTRASSFCTAGAVTRRRSWRQRASRMSGDHQGGAILSKGNPVPDCRRVTGNGQCPSRCRAHPPPCAGTCTSRWCRRSAPGPSPWT